MMATINILNLKDYFRKFDSELKKELRSNISKKLREVILSEMNKGNSPTKSKKWVPYSDSYKDAIKDGRYSRFRKRTVPVNLKLSGKLHKSLDVRLVNGYLKIEFKDEKADWHDKGAGRLPVRRILPNENEEFSNKIQRLFDMSIKKLVKKYFQN